MDAFAAGRHKLRFHHTLPSRFGVVPRHGTPGQIRWFEASPTCRYHVCNAWEEADGQGGTEIVMTGTPFRLPTGMNTQNPEYVVRDARNIADGTVARIMLPHAISSGTHACFTNGVEIRPDAAGLPT